MPDLKAAMALWEWRMVVIEDCPQSEVLELKDAIRAEWENPDGRSYWTQRIMEEAAESQKLRDISRDIANRIKQSAKDSANG